MRVERELGQGSFGTVYRIVDEQVLKVFAIKIANSVDDGDSIKSESHMYEEIQKSNDARKRQVYRLYTTADVTFDIVNCRRCFVLFYETFSFMERRCLLLEHCGLSLRDLINREYMFPLPRRQVQQIASQLIQGALCTLSLCMSCYDLNL